MAMTTIMGRSGIPSEFAGLLHSLVGHRIVNATRYSWWALQESQQKCGVTATVQDVFSLTAGPVGLEFDTGLVLGLASDPSTKSISVWVERDEAGRFMQRKPLASNAELHPILATGPMFSDQFWGRVVGAKVDAISIFVREPTSVKLASRPREVGLCFALDSGDRVVAAHGLHNDSDHFAIIPEEIILNGLRAQLRELPLPT